MTLHVKRFAVMTVGLISISAVPRVAGAQPSIQSVRAHARSVGLYEKFELSIDLKASYDNPFDARQIDLRAEFTAPSGKQQTIWGFYNPTSWASLWMVRFSPTQKGTWRYVVKVTDAQGTAQSRAGTFSVTDSPHHGFIRIVPR